eukprot:TRINITY_DN55686_c0_g1_i1.p1 TRINITY_DN55686_c0_g1~~TRINITY_DN55686_c0_g1_i1.p1  ORF type:complete len:460 (-),score=80.41 TRINITY_DN55686_c0_g1_i1:235-1614(-)
MSLICKYWVAGKCRKGGACNFAHEVVPETRECKYWQAGNCAKGQSCHFVHTEKQPHDPFASSDEDIDSPAAKEYHEKLMQQRKIAGIFAQFDLDGDGTINRQELGQVLQALDGDTWCDSVIDELLSDIDRNDDHRIDYDELLAWLFTEDDRVKTFMECVSPSVKTSLSGPQTTGFPRWMVHDRGTLEYCRTSLRQTPTRAKDYLPQTVYNGEVVEVLAIQNQYAQVKVQLCGAVGWIDKRYLSWCPEGTASVDRGSNRAHLKRWELTTADQRLKEVRRFLRRRNLHMDADDLRAKQVWFLSGHYLGDVGLSDDVKKETVFFGCADEWVESIVDGDFDELFKRRDEEIGFGMRFSTASCKAFCRTDNYLFIFEVALGPAEARLTLEKPHPSVNMEMLQEQGFLSAQCMPSISRSSKVFDHDERFVYNPLQCKPVYLIKLEYPGPLRFGGRVGKTCPGLDV